MTFAWNPERLELLRELTAQKVPASQIAVRFGVSRSSVCSAWRRLCPDLQRARQRPLAPVLPTESVWLPPTPESHRIGAPAAIAALSRGQCRWPIGAPASPSFHFCCQPTERVYCDHHAAIAYVPYVPKLRGRVAT